MLGLVALAIVAGEECRKPFSLTRRKVRGWDRRRNMLRILFLARLEADVCRFSTTADIAATSSVRSAPTLSADCLPSKRILTLGWHVVADRCAHPALRGVAPQVRPSRPAARLPEVLEQTHALRRNHELARPWQLPCQPAARPALPFRVAVGCERGILILQLTPLIHKHEQRYSCAYVPLRHNAF